MSNKVIRTKEKRAAARAELTRPVKLRCADTGRYYAGRTRDVSACGAMLEIDHPSLMVAGQQVSVGIAWSARDTVLRSDQLIPATVTRSLGLGGKQHVAVAFQERQVLSKSA